VVFERTALLNPSPVVVMGEGGQFNAQRIQPVFRRKSAAS
jgi:hypothetical protein